MLRRLRKIAPSMLACAAVLFWGLTGAVPTAHGAVAKAASPGADNHAHHYVHDVPAADDVSAVAPSDGDNMAKDGNHCYASGCSFDAVTLAPFGTVVHALASAPVFAIGTDVPKNGTAPPLRPPRLS